MIRILSDLLANDSDKLFTVPAGRQWNILWAFADFSTTATVGNRLIRLDVRDEIPTVMFSAIAPVTQAASLLNQRYNLTPGAQRSTAFVAGQLDIPIPRAMILLPGWSARFFDVNAIAAAADDLLVTLVINDYDPIKKSMEDFVT